MLISVHICLLERDRETVLHEDDDDDDESRIVFTFAQPNLFTLCSRIHKKECWSANPLITSPAPELLTSPSPQARAPSPPLVPHLPRSLPPSARPPAPLPL